MIFKHRFYLMWTVVIVVLMVVGTCNVAKAVSIRIDTGLALYYNIKSWPSFIESIDKDNISLSGDCKKQIPIIYGIGYVTGCLRSKIQEGVLNLPESLDIMTFLIIYKNYAEKYPDELASSAEYCISRALEKHYGFKSKGWYSAQDQISNDYRRWH